ncbi:alpha/beta hydrolase [Dyella sp.]|uniref:alpha/beta fold hydrolase n=1 Tax=Dyella sp. TaxID=1869338 RepID=UPI002D766E31|nr:alpha/beta hydrolase [Dyella sp.]HET7331197.1 alpha/beta hydrolase [Dyella sp.]
MTDMPQVSDDYQASGHEGDAPVPGGVLHYRLAGPTDAEQVVILESGWSASFPYAVWLEKALTPHVRVLSYDRAGIGDSRSITPLTPAGLTQQLTALLANLGIRKPVVVAGHSYGGLIAALHAAQAPTMVRAMIQIDPTPEISHELIDPSFRILPKLARFMQLCAWLKIDGPIFFHTGKELPSDIFARIKRNPRWLVHSISGSIEEIRLIENIRPIITASEGAKQCPRLVISCAPEKLIDSWLQKLLMNEDKAKKQWDAIHQLHQQQASLNTASRWMSLPYNHISLVTNRTSADTIASSILDFIR